ncbi:hypothetical protein [Nocardia kruczakiae]|uniref:hypothetical protein n=1 Tax=Nocardia kruczakiae TaxID=261477 RepID=UPI0007A3B9F8|nr:hypothetical protein [Nocardia kruczakiae]
MNTLAMLLLLAADLWMAAAGLYYGVRIIRRYRNYLLGLEWLVIGVSGTNVLFLAATGIDHSSVSYHLMVFFDAFSRSFGMTLVFVLGMMAVTRGYRASPLVEAAAFGAATVVGLWRTIDVRPVSPPWSMFYLALNLAVAVFMVTVAGRLWSIGERRCAAGVFIATILGAIVASTYDFVHIPGDDADHTLFYIPACAIWALMVTTYYHGYRALAEHNRGLARSDSRDSNSEPSSVHGRILD